MRAQVQPRRRIWPWFVGVAAIVITLLIAIVVTGHGPTGPPISLPSDSATQTASAPSIDGEPTGCLGGPRRDAKMVLTAGSSAPHTSNGAIEVATAFVRWLNQYPYPSAADIAAIEKDGLSDGAPTKDIAAFFGAKPNLSGGLVPDQSPYYLSTVPGVFYVESAAPDTVTASVGTALVINDALSPTLKGSITVTVAWERGGWKFVNSEGTRTTGDLYSIGRPFTGGC